MEILDSLGKGPDGRVAHHYRNYPDSLYDIDSWVPEYQCSHLACERISKITQQDEAASQGSYQLKTDPCNEARESRADLQSLVERECQLATSLIGSHMPRAPQRGEDHRPLEGATPQHQESQPHRKSMDAGLL
jgi:hypothetical protein